MASKWTNPPTELSGEPAAPPQSAIPTALVLEYHILGGADDDRCARLLATIVAAYDAEPALTNADFAFVVAELLAATMRMPSKSGDRPAKEDIATAITRLALRIYDAG
jgi:hypothetical protein